MADDYSTSSAGPGDAPVDDKAEVIENEDGSKTVKVTPPVSDLPSEAFNLVQFYSGSEEGKKFLNELCQKCTDDVQEDWDSCEQWREKRKVRWRLFVGDLDPKTVPWEDCANIHIPVMLERVLRVVHRMYAEMFPDKDLVFQALPSNQLSQERADIVTLHDNWQIRKEIPDFFKQNRRALMEFIIHGDCIVHSYRDIAANRNRHEALNCEEFIMPYHFKTSMIDLSDVPRKTRVLRKYKHELLELETAGVLYGVEEMLEKHKDPSFQEGPELTVRPVVDKHEGKEAPTKSKAAPYQLYEYHGRCKLPGQPTDRPVKVVFSSTKKCVLGLYLREHEDWKDRARFNAQTADLQAFTQSMDMFQQTQAQEQEMQQRLTMPDVPPEETQAIQAHFANQHGPLQPPPQPGWMKTPGQQPDPVRVIPLEEFSHGVCIENLDGSLGLGLGLLLEPFNKTANVVGSQFIDSATLANMTTVLVAGNLELESGDTRITPGEWHRVQGISPDMLQSAVKPITYPPANPQLMDVVKLMLESADGVSSAPDVLSGEAGKSNETYRGIATRVEQATKQLSVLAMNFLEMEDNVLRNNARLNAVFMPDEEIKSIVDPRTMESQNLKVGRDLYMEDFQIAFTADTRFGGREAKIAEADAIIGMITAMPPEIMGIIFPPSFVYEAVVQSLKAKGKHDLIRFLGPRPPVPTMAAGTAPPPGAMPPGGPQAGPPGGPPQGPPPGGPPPQGIPGPRPQPVQ